MFIEFVPRSNWHVIKLVREMRTNQKILLGAIVLAIITSSTFCSALKECSDDAPQTFEDNEVLEFVKNCVILTNKYEITYKYAQQLS